jgi:hypothetical protein
MGATIKAVTIAAITVATITAIAVATITAAGRFTGAMDIRRYTTAIAIRRYIGATTPTRLPAASTTEVRVSESRSVSNRRRGRNSPRHEEPEPGRHGRTGSSILRGRGGGFVRADQVAWWQGTLAKQGESRETLAHGPDIRADAGATDARSAGGRPRGIPVRHGRPQRSVHSQR